MAKPYQHSFWTSPDGLQLHYRDYPGPEQADKALAPIICLHGLTRNARDFAAVAERLCTTRRVIVPEMRGRGRSEYAKDTSTYTPSVYLLDIFKLLEDQGIDRVFSIGTSMGGILTMLMAAERPGLFAGAVLNDIGPELDPAGLDRIGSYVGQGGSFESWVHAARAIKEVQESAFPDYTLDDWLDMAKRTMVVAQNGRVSFDYDLGIVDGFKEPGNAVPVDMWPAFDALKDVPLGLIRGDISDLLAPEGAQKMADRHPGLVTAVVPRVGHAPMLDEPESIAAIDEVLKQVDLDQS